MKNPLPNMRTIMLFAVFLQALAATSARADLDVITPRPQQKIFVPETAANTFISVILQNTTSPSTDITTGIITANAPVPFSGDTKFDIVNDFGTYPDVECENKVITAGSNCTFTLYLSISDGDPFDRASKVDDVGVWFVTLNIPWSRLDINTGKTVHGTTLADVQIVVTDQIPEPGSGAMMIAGLGLLGWAGRRGKQQAG